MPSGKKPIQDKQSSSLGLPQIETTRLYRKVADLLTTRIDQGFFPIGSFLPAERELAQQLSVSRTTVREALIALETVGRVSIQHGNGVLVIAQIQPEHLDGVKDSNAIQDIGPVQFMEARRFVEVKTAELAAQHRTSTHLSAMKQSIELQRRATSSYSSEYHESDQAFHLAIARASGNPAYEIMVASLWQFRTRPLFRRYEDMLLGPERPSKTIRDHEGIYTAIEQRNIRTAGRLMKEHLDGVLRAFLEVDETT